MELEEDAFGVARSFETNGRRGIIFHDSCWSLLERALHPAPVPLAKLFEVCDSLPMAMEGGCLNWGHDYGGLHVVNSTEFFPWEDSLADAEFPSDMTTCAHSACPLAGSEVDSILGQPSQAPPAFVPPTGPTPLHGQDQFRALPIELCLAIAHYLPTSDVLNVRRASRAFWPTFHDQQFWASRFGEASDRSWFFEVEGRKGHGKDWRWLYHRTAHARLGDGLRNRKRIWGVIQHMVPLLGLQSIRLPTPNFGGNLPDWPHVSGIMPNQQPRAWGRLEGYRCQRQRIAVPEGVSQVSAWTVRLGVWEYLAGLSLATTAGEVLELGYCNLNGPSRSVRVAGLAGFNLAVGLGGIHALRCIDGQTLEQSAWLGCPDDAPRTLKLAVGGRVTGLEVCIDVRDLWLFVPQNLASSFLLS